MNQLIFRSVFIIILSAATAVLADDWPQYRGIHGDGKTAEVVSGERWPADGPRQLWKAATPKGFSSFSVADGRAFTLIAAADSQAASGAWQVRLRLVSRPGKGKREQRLRTGWGGLGRRRESRW